MPHVTAYLQSLLHYHPVCLLQALSVIIVKCFSPMSIVDICRYPIRNQHSLKSKRPAMLFRPDLTWVPKTSYIKLLQAISMQCWALWSSWMTSVIDHMLLRCRYHHYGSRSYRMYWTFLRRVQVDMTLALGMMGFVLYIYEWRRGWFFMLQLVNLWRDLSHAL